MPRNREKGAALLLSVLILAIMIALVGQMTITATHNRSVSNAALGDLQNTYGARAGYYQALLYLKTDKDRGTDKDTLHEMWASPLHVPVPQTDCIVWVHIHDAERKLNLSLLVKDDGTRNDAQVDRLRRMLRRQGHDEAVAERITDYIDGDQKGEYETGARNERLYNLEELLRIEGIDREVLYGNEEDHVKGIMEFITLWPASGNSPPKININTASAEVLATLDDDLTMPIAESIVAYRETPNETGGYQEFASPADLENVTGMTTELLGKISGFVDVVSATFEIHAKSLSGTVEKTYLFIVDRSGDNPELTGSMLQNDFLWIKPPGEEE